MKKSTILSVFALTFGAVLPVFAQTDAGTPTVSPSAPLNRPIPQKLILPTGSDQIGNITTDRAAYKPGEPVAISFTVTNPTQKPAVYNFATGQQFDVTVLDPKGTMLWQWSHDRLFTQSLGRLSLGPGQKKTYAATWNGRDAQGKPVTPGVYTISARMTSNNGQAITGGVVVNNDTDPNNMGVPTRTPVDTGAIRQVDTMPQVTASKQIAIGVPTNAVVPKK
jgi:hypothetical protein